MTEKRFLEPEIKEFLLHKEKMFGDLGENILLFEKRLSQTKDKRVKPTIADALIFSEDKGVIGVEIKTKSDSLKRLNRQLDGYNLVCDYVYVLCHDKHVAGVEQRIKRYKHHHVGIIAYTEFKGKLLGGIYKEATINKNKSVYHALNILWKVELVKILSALRHPNRVAERELGLSTQEVRTRGKAGSMQGYGTRSAFSYKMKKSQVINNIIARFGEKEANSILCQVFIKDRQHPERTLTMKHFKPQQFERGNIHDKEE